MRTITLIVIHCSATPEGKRLTFAECRRDHIAHRRFKDIGYHYYIDREGEYQTGTCSVQCAYAPEFKGLTKSQTIIVK
jgi:hypothetical protein